MKKYKLTKKTKNHLGVTLYQIEALMDFGDVKKGEKGGFIEKEENLAQISRNTQDTWIYGDAQVSGKLKLLKGYFFGIRYQKEEIKFKEIDNNYELIYKGDAEFGSDENEEAKGKKVTIKLDDGQTVTGTIVLDF